MMSHLDPQLKTLMDRCEPLSKQETLSLLPLARRGDVGAQQRVVEGNMGLVLTVAAKYFNDYLHWQGRHFDLDDLVSEGALGLYPAMRRYNYRHAFSTYAAIWIRQRIARAISERDRIIRLPVHINEKLLRYANQRCARDVRLAEREMALPGGAHVPHVESLDGIPDPFGGFSANHYDTLGELLADPHAIDPQEQALCALRRTVLDSLRRACQSANGHRLDKRECYVLLARWGLLDGAPRTLQQIAVELHVTRERVRQLQLRGYHKLEAQGEVARWQELLD